MAFGGKRGFPTVQVFTDYGRAVMGQDSRSKKGKWLLSKSGVNGEYSSVL